MTLLVIIAIVVAIAVVTMGSAVIDMIRWGHRRPDRRHIDHRWW